MKAHENLGRSAMGHVLMTTGAVSPQAMTGHLAAAFAEVASIGDEEKIIPFISAIRLVTKFDYFWVEAMRGKNGTRTEVHRMANVSNVESAQHFINALPVVQLMKGRVLADRMPHKNH